MATSMQLRREILAGGRDAALAALYGADPAVLARQRQRYADALEQFDRPRAGPSWAATTPTTSTAMVWRQL